MGDKPETGKTKNKASREYLDRKANLHRVLQENDRLRKAHEGMHRSLGNGYKRALAKAHRRARDLDYGKPLRSPLLVVIVLGYLGLLSYVGYLLWAGG